MTGLVRESFLPFVDVDLETAAELQRLGNKVLVEDSLGGVTCGELVPDGDGHAIRLEFAVERGSARTVKIRQRAARKGDGR